MFSECENMDGNIPSVFPSGLTTLSTTFYHCYKAKGQIPEIPNGVTTMSYCFSQCSNLTGPFPEIPESVSGSMYVTFAGCAKLTGALPDIPDGVTSLNRTFDGCVGATSFPSYIPPSVSDVTQAFWNCPNITGNAPELWNQSLYPNIPAPTTSSNGCFRNCTNASNYNDIPALWK